MKCITIILILNVIIIFIKCKLPDYKKTLGHWSSMTVIFMTGALIMPLGVCTTIPTLISVGYLLARPRKKPSVVTDVVCHWFKIFYLHIIFIFNCGTYSGIQFFGLWNALKYVWDSEWSHESIGVTMIIFLLETFFGEINFVQKFDLSIL